MQLRQMMLLSLSLVMTACSGVAGTSGPSGADGGVADGAAQPRLDGPQAPDQKPANTDPCANDPDNTQNKHYWSVGAWSPCSTTCGQGTRTRSVTCKACNGQAAVASSCPTPAPPKSDACSATTSCTYAWQTSTWGTCSQLCGGGTRSRTVWCQRSDGQKAADSKCVGMPPVSTMSCNSQGCNTTSCAEMKAWMQCATASYVKGIHGDPTSTTTCKLSCGSKSARCAKWINYGNSSVCVCHAVAGVTASTFPFKKTNTNGYEIFAADCPASGPAGLLSCKSAGCQKTCGAMAAWQQCTGTAYFIDAIQGSGTSAAACAKSCGKMGASCAKYLKFANSGKSCICHATTGVAASTGNYAMGNAQGLQIFSALCL